MDTLHFEPHRFDDPQGGPPEIRRMDDLNLSDLEVFMLRGRRLQAQTVGGTMRSLFVRLARRLGGSGHEPGPRHPGCHSHA